MFVEDGCGFQHCTDALFVYRGLTWRANALPVGELVKDRMPQILDPDQRWTTTLKQ